MLDADGAQAPSGALNLVLNAMQASPAGQTVTIDISKSLRRTARIKVIDRGRG